jgi:hypothetical protein
MHRLALPCILCLTFTACNGSNNYYYGNSSGSVASGVRSVDITKGTPEAAEARHYATAEILERYSPNNCSFNQYQNIYQCDDVEAAETINTRVADVRKKMDLFLLLNGFPSSSLESKYWGEEIVFKNLYGCRIVLNTTTKWSHLAYCETKIPTYLIDAMKEDGALWQEDTSYQEGYKYRIMAQ